VQGPISGAHVKGGESLEVPVRFGPKQNGTYSGSVEFYISSVNAPEGQVSLSGSSQSGCLLIAPNALDFGVIEINCNSRDRSFTLYNVCSTNQVIQTIDLQQGLSTEFHIVQKPTLPYTLSAGNSVDFKVKYAPVDSGTDQGSIAITTTKFTQPYVIPISGRGDVNAIQTDVFAQDPQPKVDVLFVVDDSGSMSAHQVSLGQNFASFIQYAEKQAVDYHIAVTTTSVDIAHGGQDDNGGTDPDENGCFVPITGSNPKVVTPLTPNLAQVFAQNVNVGTNGNYTELLIRPTYLALTNPNLSGCNNVGFLRDEANLAVVVVSDAADQDNAGAAGPMPVPFYINAFFNVKGLKRQNMFTFSSIDPKHPDTPTCMQDGSQTFDPSGNIENTRVQQVVTATGGVTDDICTQDWAKTLQKLGQTAFGYRTRFFLSNVPDVSAGNVITVQIIPPNETTPVDYPQIGPYGDTRWTYNSNAAAVDFELLAVPEPGSTIIVSYHVACLH
jgi:hypothetical protein